MGNNTKKNATSDIVLTDLDDYRGECAENFETLSIDFRGGWNLELNYTLNKGTYYELNSIMFKYILDADTFPNTTELGPKTVLIGNMTEFSANKDNSYKCFAQTQVDLSEEVTLEFSNYQAQPFLPKKSSGSAGFDTAVECSADTTGTSKLVPIIVGSALAVLVIMVLIAYIIGRRKHRPGYVQV